MNRRLEPVTAVASFQRPWPSTDKVAVRWKPLHQM